ncbi:MAG TPA: YhjD/YihY/BrkB family envelope integrity protein [Candidatus Acidoferrales bacterium]|nr:YhjD/YihY/BrkB family envelope integrity protein [Candidatus Acidoferrales bacterium]
MRSLFRGAPGTPAWLVKTRNFLTHLTVVARARYYNDLLSLQAMSLTYTTILSLVPFLAVMFSVLKAFGVQDFLEPFLLRILEPLGDQGAEITNRIVVFVENIRVGILGAVGFAMLFYTVVSLIAKIEDAMNLIWRIPHARGWGQRFTAYLSVVLVGPVMVFTALALTASAQSYWLVERLAQFAFMEHFFALTTSVMPFLLMCATFTFLYRLVPYTRVQLSSALIGGATASILWQVAGNIFTAFVANSASYAAIYSSFAAAIVFLIWLYVGWLIFLVGGEIAYFHQHPQAFLREGLLDWRAHFFQEWLALSALVEITRRHLAGATPWRSTELAGVLGVSGLEYHFDKFVRAAILLRSSEPEGIALARPPEEVTVEEVLDIVRGSEAAGEVRKRGVVAELLERRDQAVKRALQGVTLRSLASDSEPQTLKVRSAGLEAQFG